MATTVYKKGGDSVFPFRGEGTRCCVLDVLLQREPWRAEVDWPLGFEGGISHRLDISTSGALLVADSPDELAQIREVFADRGFCKRYVFKTDRRVGWEQNQLVRAIAHDRRHKKRMVVRRGPSTAHRGRWYEAETRFYVDNNGIVRVQMSTGVMHQIRVHAAFLGLALCGDRLYGGGHSAEAAALSLDFFLHHEGLSGGGFSTQPVRRPLWMGYDG